MAFVLAAAGCTSRDEPVDVWIPVKGGEEQLTIRIPTAALKVGQVVPVTVAHRNPNWRQVKRAEIENQPVGRFVSRPPDDDETVGPGSRLRITPEGGCTFNVADADLRREFTCQKPGKYELSGHYNGVRTARGDDLRAAPVMFTVE
jgi:hypothetical protein